VLPCYRHTGSTKGASSLVNRLAWEISDQDLQEVRAGDVFDPLISTPPIRLPWRIVVAVVGDDISRPACDRGGPDRVIIDIV
jgi:hypothetical protein